MKQHLINMLEMQDAMNAKVNEDWRERDHAWYRAIWIESAELMDHYGWKWWKKQEADREQVVLELVDIWHFGLSIVLMSGDSLEDCAAMLEAGLSGANTSEDFRGAVECFAKTTLDTKGFDVAGFAKLMNGVALSFEGLYLRYIGKNVLNFFRQDNGYKDGSYKKVWSGREDNEHLAELLTLIGADVPDIKTKLYEGLASRYQCA